MAERWANVCAKPPKISSSNLYFVSIQAGWLCSHCKACPRFLQCHHPRLLSGRFLWRLPLGCTQVPLPSLPLTNNQPTTFFLVHRMKYGNIFWGSVASAAPILAGTVDPEIWFKLVSDTFVNHGMNTPLSYLCVLTTCIFSSQIRVVRRRFAAVSRRWQI